MPRLYGIMLLVFLLIAVISQVMFMNARALTGDYSGDIVIDATVHDGDQIVENATVEVVNESGQVVDSGLTDSEGSVQLVSSQNLTNATLRVSDEDYDDTLKKDINVTLPADSNQTVLESYTFNYGTDYSEEAKSYYDRYTYVVLAGAVIFFIVIVAIVRNIMEGNTF